MRQKFETSALIAMSHRRKADNSQKTNKHKVMKKLSPFLQSAAVLISSTAALSGCSGSGPNEIIVCGTYTASGSHGVYSLLFDSGSGTLSVLDSARAVNPSYVAISADASRVYAVDESGGNSGIYGMEFDPSTGHFGRVRRIGGTGDDPCFIALIGNEIVTADYSGGSVSFFPIGPDGFPGERSRCDRFTGCGPDTVRQTTPHIHCTMPSPDGKHLFVTDLGTDRIYHYTIGPDGISPTDTIAVEAGFGPRHLAFTPDGRHCYAIGELSGKVLAMDFDGTTLLPRQTLQCDTLQARASADIHTSHDGKFLYASNRRKGDGIRTFSIADDGTLTDVGYTATGRHPRNFVISPDDRHLIVASRDDNRVEVYSRDIATGALSLRSTLSLPMPVCLRFLPR